MKISPCQPSEIVTQMDDGQLFDTLVQDRIVRIDVVNDLETATHDGKRSQLLSTRGSSFLYPVGTRFHLNSRLGFRK
ncbi:MAG: hypothetical protein Q4G03_00145 [Planctomycetia bacterium]|nr:hypothetical protein [Planctomycetia bacterium]